MKNNKGTGELIEGHEYDGIQELDHPLPKWWLNLFYATIVFAFGYYGYYELMDGPSHQEQYETAMSGILANKAKFAEAEEAEPVKEVSLDDLLKDTKALAAGKSVYNANCAACHAKDGGGVIGPNLTDKYWLYSKGDFDGIMKAIKKGFPDKGMPPWEDVVPKAKHAPLAAYVISLQGTKPASPKDPQGELVQ